MRWLAITSPMNEGEEGPVRSTGSSFRKKEALSEIARTAPLNFDNQVTIEGGAPSMPASPPDGRAGPRTRQRKHTFAGVGPGGFLGDVAGTAQEIERHLRARIENESFPIPSMPRAVLLCLETLRAPEAPLDRVARALAEDPLVAARVVRVANSARFAGLAAAANLQQAITRLGLRELEMVIMEAAVRQLFESSDPRIAEACRGIWAHSRAVAIVARECATMVGAGDPEDSYLAGLLHDVGKPIVAGFLLEIERALVGRPGGTWIEAASWIDVVQRGHRSVGLALGRKWQMPRAVMQALDGCADYGPNPHKSPANCVRLANLWAKREGIYVGQVNRDEAELLITEGVSLLGLDPRQVASLGTGVRESLALDES
jgi:putative nucleotidyltransferase with HDIG domain